MIGTKKYYPTPSAAEYLGLSRKTMEKYRLTGEGPVFHKLGRRVFYTLEDLDSWASRHRRRSTSDQG